MAVIRINKTHDYTVMSNNHFREKEMSLKAKGLLSLMLSLPDEWEYTIEGLATLNHDGKDSIRAALNELERFGYMKRCRARNDKGVLEGTVYTIYEHPILDEPTSEKPTLDNPTSGNPTLEKPTLGNPTLGNPTLGNPTLLNTNISSTKELSTKESNTDSIKGTSEDKAPVYYPNDIKLNQAFIDFLDMRKAIRKPAKTEQTIKLLMKKLQELATVKNEVLDTEYMDNDLAVKILEQSTMACWQGLFPLKKDKQTQNNGIDWQNV